MFEVHEVMEEIKKGIGAERIDQNFNRWYVDNFIFVPIEGGCLTNVVERSKEIRVYGNRIQIPFQGEYSIGNLVVARLVDEQEENTDNRIEAMVTKQPDQYGENTMNVYFTKSITYDKGIKGFMEVMPKIDKLQDKYVRCMKEIVNMAIERVNLNDGYSS